MRPKLPSGQSMARTWLESFRSYVSGECHLAENTVAAYGRDLERFIEWLAGRSIHKLTIRELADYAGWLHKKKLAPASIARHIVSLKVFFRYLQLENVISDNLAELLGSQKLWQRVPKVLSPQQVDRLLQAPRKYDPYWRRDRALLELLYATGCRASELSHLKLRDLHLVEGYCICRGKGDKE
ncbi:MAG TPA: site-specific integrase, partial [Thermoguttaceae bacterium]